MYLFRFDLDYKMTGWGSYILMYVHEQNEILWEMEMKFNFQIEFQFQNGNKIPDHIILQA